MLTLRHLYVSVECLYPPLTVSSAGPRGRPQQNLSSMSSCSRFSLRNALNVSKDWLEVSDRIGRQPSLLTLRADFRCRHALCNVERSRYEDSRPSSCGCVEESSPTIDIDLYPI